jgi:Fic-DOC domain mobile mystery protein B
MGQVVMKDFEKLEGATSLDPDEKEGLKISHVKTREELNELEQANIEEGLRWLARQRNPEVLSERFIRQLHVKLFGEVWDWAGQFRKTNKNIGVDWPMIPSELKLLMGDVEYWLEH